MQPNTRAIANRRSKIRGKKQHPILDLTGFKICFAPSRLCVKIGSQSRRDATFCRNTGCEKLARKVSETPSVVKILFVFSKPGRSVFRFLSSPKRRDGRIFSHGFSRTDFLAQIAHERSELTK